MENERNQICGCSGGGQPVGYPGDVVGARPPRSLQLIIDMLDRAERRKAEAEKKREAASG